MKLFTKRTLTVQQFRRSVCVSAIALTLTLTVLAALSCSGGRQAAGFRNLAEPVPFTERAITGTLPSGLRYFLLENAMPEGRAFLTLAVDAGSVLETEEERGLAHFVEHMAFRGTAHFPGSELINYLRSLGMRFGADINAHVSFDETVYRIEVPVESADDRRIIPARALQMLDDWSWGLTFDPEAVESERLVVLEEYRFRMGAGERINRQLFPALFRDSLYAERLPIGLLEVIENATPQQLEDFYRKWYKPENMTVIIAGDFDAVYLHEQIDGHFPYGVPDTSLSGELPSGGVTQNPPLEPFYRPRHDLRPPEQGRLQTIVLTDSELTRSRIDMYWKRPQQDRRQQNVAAYRDSIIDNLIATMLSMRFTEAAARPDTPFMFAGGGTMDFAYSSRFYVLVAQANSGGVRGSLRELLETQQTLARHGFTQDELEVAKETLLSHLNQAVSEKDRQHSNEFVHFLLQHFLQGETVPDIEWEQKAITSLLPGITLNEINQATRNYFTYDDLTVAVTAPETERETLPADSEIAALVTELRLADIKRPVINRARGALMSDVPQPGAITAETLDSETGAIRWTLANGAEVILKETANRNNEISFVAQARGGTLGAPADTSVSAALAADMLNVSGMGKHTRTDLVSILAGKQVSLAFWAQNNLRGFRGSFSTWDASLLFEMLHLSFTEPRIEHDAAQALLAQRRSSMAFAENDPNTVFNREITRATHGNPRFHPLELSDIDRFNIDEAMAFLRAALNPADYTFVFTGNIDVPALRSLTETYLASIPRSAANPSDWSGLDPRRPRDTSAEIRMGLEERSTVYASWFVPLAYSERKAQAAAVLNEYLDIRLMDEIREKLGGVYTLSAWVSLTPLVGDGELSGGVFFVCDPGRVQELSAAALAEFRSIASGAVNAETFANAVLALIQSHEVSMQNNAHIAGSFANSAVIFR
ncbi:MAG: insulinase family protein, partial [Treponema sp.]|nr:insulinase family protein [Treponema sp.]